MSVIEKHYVRDVTYELSKSPFQFLSTSLFDSRPPLNHADLSLRLKVSLVPWDEHHSPFLSNVIVRMGNGDESVCPGTFRWETSASGSSKG